MNKQTIVGLGITIAIIFTGGYFYMNGQPGLDKPSMNTTTIQEGTGVPAVTDSVMEKTKEYTLSDIASHSTSDDCWMAIEGNVYDVTGFVASGKHPGKDAILEGCGKDATELFNTRPMGSGTPHSDNARDNLANFQIGTRADE